MSYQKYGFVAVLTCSGNPRVLISHSMGTKICPGYESQGTFEDSGLNIREEPRAKFDVPGATKIQMGLGRKIYGNG